MKKRLFLSPARASNSELWSKFGLEPSLSLVLLWNLWLHFPEAGRGSLSSVSPPAGLSDHARCLGSCQGCGSCQSIKSQGSASLNDCQGGPSAKRLQPGGALPQPTPHSLFGRHSSSQMGPSSPAASQGLPCTPRLMW